MQSKGFGVKPDVASQIGAGQLIELTEAYMQQQTELLAVVLPLVVQEIGFEVSTTAEGQAEFMGKVAGLMVKSALSVVQTSTEQPDTEKLSKLLKTQELEAQLQEIKQQLGDIGAGSV